MKREGEKERGRRRRAKEPLHFIVAPSYGMCVQCQLCVVECVCECAVCCECVCTVSIGCCVPCVQVEQ